MYKKPTLRLFVVATVISITSMPAIAGPAEDAYAIASGHYYHQRWAQATEEFSAFLERHPDHKQAATAMFFLGESLVQQSKYADGRKWFLKFLERDSNHRFACQAIFRTGEASYLSGHRKDAERELNWFRDQFPDDHLNEFVLPYLAEIALHQQQYDVAISYYRKALDSFPEGPMVEECHFGLARAVEGKGDVATAAEKYQIIATSDSKLADDAHLQIGITKYNAAQYAAAEHTFATFLKRFPESNLRPHAGYWLGMSQVAQQKWQAASRTLESVAGEHPKHDLTAATLYWAGETFRRQDDLESATAYYQRVINEWPDNDWADDCLQTMIQIQFDSGQFEQVDTLVAQFIGDYGNSSLRPLVIHLHGRSLLKRARYADAIAEFDKLATVVPAEISTGPHAADTGDIDAKLQNTNWYYLGLAQLGAGENEKALLTLERFRPADDQSELAGGILVARATALMAMEKFAEASVPLRKYLVDYPTGTEISRCRLQLALVLARIGQIETAITWHRELPEQDAQDPSYIETTYFLAEAAYAANLHEDAGRLFAIVMKNAKDEKQIAKGLSGLGWTFAALGNTDAAAEAFTRLTEQYPTSPQAAEATLMRAKSLANQNRNEEALDTYLALAANFPKSNNAAHAMFEAAALQEKLGQKNAAITTLKQLLVTHPDFDRADAALYQLAWLLADNHQNADADIIFKRLYNDHRGSRYWSDATYRLAERAARNEHPEIARRLAHELLDADGDQQLRGHALYLLGQLAASNRQWDQVTDPLQQMVRLFPESELRFPAEYWLAESKYQQKQFDQALDAFARLNARIGARKDQWLAMIPLRYAQLLAYKERWNEAYQQASTIAGRFPNFDQQYEVDYVIGRCLAMQAKFDEARILYQRVQQSPQGGKSETAAMAAWMTGESYFHQKNYDDAIKAYHRVVVLFAYPQWQAAALLQAAKCHELKNEKAQAAGLFRQLLAEHPDTTFAKEAAERLQRIDAAPATTAEAPANFNR